MAERWQIAEERRTGGRGAQIRTATQATSFQLASLPSFSPPSPPRLIDTPRHLSVHVGGMLITAQPLVEVVPLEHATKPGVVVAQWNKDSVEDAGLIKIDLLSLRTLGMLTEVCALIEGRHGRQTRPGRAAPGRSRRLPAACRRGHHRLLPGGEPRPKLDAAAAPTPLLRGSGDRGFHRAARPDPGRDGASLPSPAAAARNR